MKKLLCEHPREKASWRAGSVFLKVGVVPLRHASRSPAPPQHPLVVRPPLVEKKIVSREMCKEKTKDIAAPIENDNDSMNVPNQLCGMSRVQGNE